ncbi:protein adenylyltransferase SelO family protein [Psychrosphaera ytuae]
MPADTIRSQSSNITTLDQLGEHSDYSYIRLLNADPQATPDGRDHRARQVFSGHYVPVKPTPIASPQYITHSETFFKELGLDDSLATDEGFIRLFSGDMTSLPDTMKSTGWATGYALSIYGTEYVQQCPFHTGNGYGDGRAISVVEAVLNDKRWEMQLKGAGPTPYCRGADGRAVLRSSVREFLAQELMHALGVPTSRSLTLYTSLSERVDRPWYYPDSQSTDPEIMVSNPVAISTRVAPSFIRVGQIELFARRARSNEHPTAHHELQQIVEHLITREYSNDIDLSLPLTEQVVELAKHFQSRLINLVSNWLRVGFCQGNFNSDNCAAGGFTLDYGPFGFCELFEPAFQPWTGGGRHFSFFNQPAAAQKNYEMFCKSLRVLLEGLNVDAEASNDSLQALEVIEDNFSNNMEQQLNAMWAQKLGLAKYDTDLFVELITLMANTGVDYTIFFRELSSLPNELSDLDNSFYRQPPEDLLDRWNTWLAKWQQAIKLSELNDHQCDIIKQNMQKVNPKYTWREWRVVPAYQNAENGQYGLIHELQELFATPYKEGTAAQNEKYYTLRPQQYLFAGGVSHYSCSS